MTVPDAIMRVYDPDCLQLSPKVQTKTASIHEYYDYTSSQLRPSKKQLSLFVSSKVFENILWFFLFFLEHHLLPATKVLLLRTSLTSYFQQSKRFNLEQLILPARRICIIS